ncbi:uncharacterized protein AB675_3971 [Cyphellophora attinorum]|uniref:Uncharacterized protein n=1 Tax=Cyphellophora attinorum TaxID=1664694 RepID=A0A0N0NKA2_9EURO|nr:uncharacterized protein AB675_3971 [Phialophora attinorum]KPI37599.1 hypothetical protein AB675_3971 [Phialophora attinorum]
MIRSTWAKLVWPSDKQSSSNFYELSDILRESLESPIPEDPRIGWQPYSEVEKSRYLPSARLPRSRYTAHADLEEYHADDELSELPSPVQAEAQTNIDLVSANEDRSGLASTTKDRSPDLSSFSYYYYIDPDLVPESVPSETPTIIRRDLLDQREGQALSPCEPISRADEWRQEVVRSQDLGLGQDDAPLDEPRSSVYQRLHDTPVESGDTEHAIRTWQGTTAVGSLDSPKMPPPSFMEQFQLKPAAGVDEEEDLFTHAEEVEDETVSESSSSSRTVRSLLLEEDTSKVLEFGEELRQEAPRRVRTRRRRSTGGSSVRTRQFRLSLHKDPAKALADLSDYQAVFRKIRGDSGIRPEQIEDRLQRLTTMLNKREATVEELGSFWEVQK